MRRSVAVAAIALSLDALVGDPEPLYRRVGHPVRWIGALVAVADRRLNRPRWSGQARIAGGILALGAILGIPVAAAVAITRAADRLLPRPLATALLGVLAATLPAQRSLHRHVADVARALDRGGLEAGRAAVARIVGRDTAALDAAGVSRAAIESLAENFSDGVVAPVVWCALLGLPGIVAYKAANTADSMIGHRTARHLAFGRAAARFDDAVNLPASRLSALWLLLAAPRRAGAILRALGRDARRHRSPNAGWPEAAMAAALGLRLAGPRRYGGRLIEDAWMGDGRARCTTADVRAALALFRRACAVQAAALGALLALSRGRG